MKLLDPELVKAAGLDESDRAKMQAHLDASQAIAKRLAKFLTRLSKRAKDRGKPFDRREVVMALATTAAFAAKRTDCPPEVFVGLIMSEMQEAYGDCVVRMVDRNDMPSDKPKSFGFLGNG